MYILVCLFVLLPLQALGASLVIPTESYQEEIRKVRRYHVTYGFIQASSGDFQVLVNIRYRNTGRKIERYKEVMLRLQRGVIVQQDPKTLVLRLQDRDLVVGKHRWWYGPYWQAADGVRIACDHHKRFTTVVVENCRLTIEEPRAENAFLLRIGGV